MGHATSPSCVGSGVPGDEFEYGHSIIPGTEQQMFPHYKKFENRYSRRRCIRCQSERYHWKRQDCYIKASAWCREHATKMVKRGYAKTKQEALDIMRRSGLTADFAAGEFRAAIGKECPGLCGWPLRHIITTHADCQGDWRDPRFPLTPENFGVLCATCNQQKNEKPWAEFMARQRAIRITLESAVPNPPPPKQLGLFGDAA